MAHIYANGDEIAYGIKHFTKRTFEDLMKINVSPLIPGSTAFIIDTSENYMLNSQKQWKKVQLDTLAFGGGSIIHPGNSGSTDDDDDDNEYVWEPMQ